MLRIVKGVGRQVVCLMGSLPFAEDDFDESIGANRRVLFFKMSNKVLIYVFFFCTLCHF